MKLNMNVRITVASWLRRLADMLYPVCCPPCPDVHDDASDRVRLESRLETSVGGIIGAESDATDRVLKMVKDYIETDVVLNPITGRATVKESIVIYERK